ncbi:hypothetical protein P2318_25380 [Myxococcaceae bacterium GXIMD 01537]
MSHPLGAEEVTVEVLAAGGTRVRFVPGTDVDYVARLVVALGRASC